MIDENRKYQRPGVARVRDFLLSFNSELSGVITPNYDLLIEYALGTRLFNYGRPGEVLSGRGAYPVSQWQNPVTLRGPIAVAKLHGSVSWTTSGKHTDGRGGITGNALIVAPTPEKSPPPELAFAWNTARDILLGAKVILVFGFAFNPYDEALLKHLQQHGRKLERVILVDKNPKCDPRKRCGRMRVSWRCHLHRTVRIWELGAQSCVGRKRWKAPRCQCIYRPPTRGEQFRERFGSVAMDLCLITATL